MNPLIRSSRASFARITLAIVVCMFVGELNAADAPARIAIVRALDLDVNETKGVELANGTRARVKLLRVDETRDALRDAVRQARVQIELNGQSLVLTSATYHLPVTAAGVQIDCPITKGYVTRGSGSGRQARRGSSRAHSFIRSSSAGLPAIRKWPTNRRS